jgi:DNA-binding IclR family transcriptional regulator
MTEPAGQRGKRLSPQCAQALAAVKEIQGLTAMHLGDCLMMDHQMLYRRLGELCKLGLVARDGMHRYWTPDQVPR